MFGFFKSKKQFEEEVQKEADKREQKRKEEAVKAWKEWKENNEIDINYGNEFKLKYVEAEQAFKEGKYQYTLDTLNNIIENNKDIIGMYVFILLADVSKQLGGIEGGSSAYDRGIEYYGSVTGEYTERWKEDLIRLKSEFVKTEEEKERMRKNYNFTISDPMFIALNRLEGIKVDQYRNKDYADQDSFYKVWWSVLHEVDMYEEGEESPLNKTTLKGAKNWLKSFSHLCEGDVPEEYKPKEA